MWIQYTDRCSNRCGHIIITEYKDVTRCNNCDGQVRIGKIYKPVTANDDGSITYLKSM